MRRWTRRTRQKRRRRSEPEARAISIAIHPLHPGFVGEVSGIDLTRPLARDEVAAIEAGMDRYAVLVFHDQRLTDDQQMAFSRNFGELEATLAGEMTKPEERRMVN